MSPTIYLTLSNDLFKKETFKKGHQFVCYKMSRQSLGTFDPVTRGHRSFATVSGRSRSPVMVVI